MSSRVLDTTFSIIGHDITLVDIFLVPTLSNEQFEVQLSRQTKKNVLLLSSLLLFYRSCKRDDVTLNLRLSAQRRLQQMK